jgi:hypothetical protein
MLDCDWTINIAVGAKEIERQVIELVEQMDELGIFDIPRQIHYSNDNVKLVK